MECAASACNFPAGNAILSRRERTKGFGPSTVTRPRRTNNPALFQPLGENFKDREEFNNIQFDPIAGNIECDPDRWRRR
jgi:hypothetical protein